MTKAHLDDLKKMANSPNYQAVVPLIGSVLYLADRVNQLQDEKRDIPMDEPADDQKISRPARQKMAIDIITSAGEDKVIRTRIYKALRSLQ